MDARLPGQRRGGGPPKLNDAAGTTDSVGLALLKPDTSGAFTYQSFGRSLFLDLLRRNDPESTVVVSPTSAGLALSMVYVGARDATAQAMSHVLGADGQAHDVFASRNRVLLQRLNGRTDVTLEISNASWVTERLKVLPRFRQTVADDYRATFAQVKLPSGKARDEINTWAKRVSHGKIPSILADSLPDTTVMFVASAVYFKGKWLAQFQKSATRERPFHLVSGGTTPMQGMERTGRYAYRRFPGYEMLRIPHRAGKTAMYVLLPTDGTNMHHRGSCREFRRTSRRRSQQANVSRHAFDRSPSP
ncbi:MAG: serpin family protein [Gemmatimonadaceae bacterium]